MSLADRARVQAEVAQANADTAAEQRRIAALKQDVATAEDEAKRKAELEAAAAAAPERPSRVLTVVRRALGVSKHRSCVQRRADVARAELDADKAMEVAKRKAKAILDEAITHRERSLAIAKREAERLLVEGARALHVDAGAVLRPLVKRATRGDLVASIDPQEDPIRIGPNRAALDELAAAYRVLEARSIELFGHAGAGLDVHIQHAAAQELGLFDRCGQFDRPTSMFQPQPTAYSMAHQKLHNALHEPSTHSSVLANVFEDYLRELSAKLTKDDGDPEMRDLLDNVAPGPEAVHAHAAIRERRAQVEHQRRVLASAKHHVSIPRKRPDPRYDPRGAALEESTFAQAVRILEAAAADDSTGTTANAVVALDDVPDHEDLDDDDDDGPEAA